MSCAVQEDATDESRSRRLAELWDAYRAEPTVERRNRLVLVYAPFVKAVVGRLPLEVRACFEAEDLVGYGLLGLIDAIERYLPTKQARFETYATHRIRGAILDAVRQLDHVKRAVRDQSRAVRAEHDRLATELRRAPSARELSEATGVASDQVGAILAGLTVAAPLSLEAARSPNGRPIAEAFGCYDDRLEELVDELDRDQELACLRTAQDQLDERRRTVIHRYYFERRTLAAIGEELGVSESRVSQLRSSAIARLRELMAPLAG